MSFNHEDFKRNKKKKVTLPTKGEDSLKARNYFEDGCLCILKGNLQKVPPDTDNWKAVEHYEKECTCSRNYKHLEKASDNSTSG